MLLLLLLGQPESRENRSCWADLFVYKQIPRKASEQCQPGEWQYSILVLVLTAFLPDMQLHHDNLIQFNCSPMFIALFGWTSCVTE